MMISAPFIETVGSALAPCVTSMSRKRAWVCTLDSFGVTPVVPLPVVVALVVTLVVVLGVVGTRTVAIVSLRAVPILVTAIVSATTARYGYLTSDVDWDLSVLDQEFPLHGDEEFLDAAYYDNGTNFDAFGNYRKATIKASTCLDHHPILQETVLPDDILIAKVADDDPDVDTDLGDDFFLDLRLTDLFDGEAPSTIVVKSKGDPDALSDFPVIDAKNGKTKQDVTPLVTFVDTSELVGRIFLMSEREDGQRPNCDAYEYIAVYVDDLAFAMRDPHALSQCSKMNTTSS